MRKRMSIVGKIIRVLPLIMLLLWSSNVMPRERANGTYERNRLPVGASVSGSDAQVSGDGLIAFSDGEQIYVMNADGSDVVRLTDGASGVVYGYPAFSPDGKRIAFIRDESSDHALYIVGLDGSGLRRLSASSVALAEPTWSPDGSKIAYLRGHDTTAGGLANLTACGAEIYVIDVFSRRETNLTQGAGGVDPSWSPDGTRIAFSSLRDDNYEIYTMAADGSDVQRLTNTEWAEAEPAWSPDGKRIAYTSHLLQMRLDCGFMSTGRPGESPDEEPTSICIMDTDGTNQTQLALTSEGTEPTWSRDGARLALVINGKGGSQIYTTDADGNSLTKLTWDSTPKSSPSWSPTVR